MKIETPADARRLAEALRHEMPALAARIEQMADDADAGKRDGLNIDVGIQYKLEKFEGDSTTPFEVIEGTG